MQFWPEIQGLFFFKVGLWRVEIFFLIESTLILELLQEKKVVQGANLSF